MNNEGRAVNPLCLQILRIDREGMIPHGTYHMAHDIICAKNTC